MLTFLSFLKEDLAQRYLLPTDISYADFIQSVSAKAKDFNFGAFSSVYKVKHPDDIRSTVTKIIETNEKHQGRDGYLPYLLRCASIGRELDANPYTPRVIEIALYEHASGNYAKVVLEKLFNVKSASTKILLAVIRKLIGMEDDYTFETELLNKIVKSAPFLKTVSENTQLIKFIVWLLNYHIQGSDIVKTLHISNIDWLDDYKLQDNRLIELLDTIRDLSDYYHLDLHEYNFMFRAGLHLVITDPLGERIYWQRPWQTQKDV